MHSVPAAKQSTEDLQEGAEGSCDTEAAPQHSAESKAETVELQCEEYQTCLRPERGRPCKISFGDQQMQSSPRHASIDNDPVSLALLTPMHFVRMKDQFDPIWTASLSNVLRKLQGKALLAHLIVDAAKWQLQALAAEDYPLPPTCIVGSPWSTYLWVEVSANTGS